MESGKLHAVANLALFIIHSTFIALLDESSASVVLALGLTGKPMAAMKM